MGEACQAAEYRVKLNPNNCDEQDFYEGSRLSSMPSPRHKHRTGCIANSINADIQHTNFTQGGRVERPAPAEVDDHHCRSHQAGGRRVQNGHQHDIALGPNRKHSDSHDQGQYKPKGPKAQQCMMYPGGMCKTTARRDIIRH